MMWIVVATFYGYQYFLQVSPGVMAKELIQDLHLNATTLGVLAACYFYAYAGMQIPAGVMVDRYGTRRPLFLAAAICAGGALLFGYAPNFIVTALGRLMIGLGGAFAAVSSLYIAANWLPLKYFTSLSGTLVTLGMLGAIFGQYPLATMVDHIGWRHTMIIFGIFGALIAIATWLVIRDRNPSPHPDQHLLTGLKHVIKNRQIWLLAIYGGMMFMSISILGSLWGVPFLMAKYNIPDTLASSNLIALFVGLGIGCPLLCWVSDHWERRKFTLFTSSSGALISIIPVLYLPIPYWCSAVALFAFGFFMGGFLVSFGLARVADHNNNTGATMGLMNTANMIGGALMQPVCGLIMDLSSQGTKIYTLIDYQIALSVIPLTTIIALVIIFWIKEKP